MFHTINDKLFFNLSTEDLNKRDCIVMNDCLPCTRVRKEMCLRAQMNTDLNLSVTVDQTRIYFIIFFPQKARALKFSWANVLAFALR